MVRMKIIKEKQSKRGKVEQEELLILWTTERCTDTWHNRERERITAFQFGINSFALVQNAEGQ